MNIQFDKITIDELIGNQQRPEGASGFQMYYMHYVEPMTLAVSRFIVNDGSGYTSIDELLSEVAINHEFQVSSDDQHDFALHVIRTGNHIATISQRGFGKLVTGTSDGTFVAYVGTNQFDRPIYSYEDSFGTCRYIKSPIFDQLVVRIS